ncbi:ABC transporter permease [Gandjariella thermophila]|uniref:Oligopeptide transport system permease protein OppC n=1 Tax=Gandjariella thermophila TaxID=1931992 RepID=A0A4D4J8Q0_9PSEU|nr:ABC transporter permease [Gandjariella thermophila]GDY33195.1 ABC transporter permease [Gandjariella thermophila]
MTMSRTEQDAAGTLESAAGSPVEPGFAPGAATTRGRLVLRRFLRNRLALVGLVVVVLLYVTAFLGPAISPWTYDSQDYTAFLVPPSPSHWFGTTQIGGDVFVQTMRGLQKSLTIGLLVGVISTSVAAVVGAAAGYFGGWADRALMWLVDLLLVLPSFLILAILSPGLQQTGWLIFVVLLAAFSWMITARIVRGMTLSLREREFVKAARFMGEAPWRIIARHILPNMASLLIIDATINVGTAVLTETGLSYFGFGVQPPDVSLGTLIRDGTQSALTTPWLFLPAGILLIVSVLAVNFVGDGLRDALDPSSTRGRRRERRAKATAGRRAAVSVDERTSTSGAVA